MNRKLSICVLGSGAIGGLLGAALAGQGHSLTFVDHGKCLAALRRRGLTLIGPDNHTTSVTRADYLAPDSIGAGFDLVLLTVKAHQIAELSDCLQRILVDDTLILTFQNGIPWWYFQGSGCALDCTILESLDPGGLITASVPANSIIGCVAYPGAEVVKHGVIRHVEGDRFVLGEPGSGSIKRVKPIADLLTEAGFRGQTQTDIRAEIWLKAWGSFAFNPLSALTGATMRELCRSTDTRTLIIELMREAEAVAASLGVAMRVPLERRLAGAEKVGEHKTSMLQDLEAGRRMEVDAVMGSIIEIGELTGVSMPQSRKIYASVQQLNSSTSDEL